MDFGSLDKAEAEGLSQATAPGSSGSSSSTVQNLALGCRAHCSSFKGPGREAANAVDGDPGTRWTSAYADDQWLSVDLGEVHQLARIDVRWEAAYAAIYLLQGSLDGSAWTTFASAAGREGWVETQLRPGSAARVVRIYGQRRATRYGFSIWELQVLGGSHEAQVPKRARTPPRPFDGRPELADLRVLVLGALSGESLLDVRMDASTPALRVRDVKCLLEEHEGTPPCEQQLLHAGRLLHEGEAVGAVVQRGEAAEAADARCLEFRLLRLPPGRAALLQDIKRGAKNIWDLPAELHEEPEFVLAAVQRNVLALRFAAEGAKDDRELMLLLLRERSEALKYASERLRDDPEVVLTAVEGDPNTVKFASHSLRSNGAVMLAALRRHRSAIRFATPELLADPNFRAEAEQTGVFRDADFEHLLQVSPDEALELQEKGSCVFVDARDRSEFEASHVAGAHHKSDVARLQDVPELRRGFHSRGCVVVVYSDNGLEQSRCLHLVRSLRQNPELQAHRVLRLTGGLNAWKQAGHPVHGDKRLMIKGKVTNSDMVGVLQFVA